MDTRKLDFVRFHPQIMFVLFVFGLTVGAFITNVASPQIQDRQTTHHSCQLPKCYLTQETFDNYHIDNLTTHGEQSLKSVYEKFKKVKDQKGHWVLQELIVNGKNSLDRMKGVGFHPRTMIDIGANKGDFTRDMQRLFPGIHSLMVEPNTDHKTKLQKFGNADTAYVMLADVEEENATYWKGNHYQNTGNSKMKPLDQKGFYQTKVPQMTLDTLAKGKQFDFCKIDVQGAEMLVLRGGSETILGCEFVYIECFLYDSYEGQPGTLKDIVGWMQINRFVIWDIGDIRYAESRKGFPMLRTVDFIFAQENSSYISEAK